MRTPAMAFPKHHETCALYEVHWLRHAVDAVQHLLAGAEPHADRLAAASLLNALEHFAERPEWETTTLADVIEYASLMGETFSDLCSCDGPESKLKW